MSAAEPRTEAHVSEQGATPDVTSRVGTPHLPGAVSLGVDGADAVGSRETGAGRPSGARVPYDVLLESSTDLLSVHDFHGRVIYANAACCAVLGIEPADFVGSNPYRLVHPDDRQRLIATMVELRRRPGDVHVFSVRARHADGTYRDLESLARNGLDDPLLGGVLLSTRDVSDRALAQEALAASEARHRRLVEGVPVGVVVADSDGRVRFANASAQRLTGVADLIGRSVTDFLYAPDRARCRKAMLTAIEGRVVPGPSDYRLALADGRDVVVSSTPLPYEWEGERAALLMLQDVTELHRAQVESRAAQERLARILEATAEGIIGIGGSGQVVFINAAAADVLGLDVQDAIGQRAHPLYHHSYPDGTPYDERDCPAYRAATTGETSAVTGEVLWRADGSPVPVEYRATPMPGEHGGGAVLTFHDITERIRAREQLAARAVFQRAVLDALPSLTAVVDRNGVIIEVNQAWTQHCAERGGDPAGVGVGVDFVAVCERTAGPSRAGALEVAEGLRSLLAGEREQYQRDVPCQLPNGGETHFSLMMVPLQVSEGGVVIGYSDITARKQLEVDAAHRATHDVLTGLPNRTLLLERLKHALSERGAPSVGLLFLDLDGFKLVNDGYGHEAGDTVLRVLANRLRGHVRPSDTVARLSGDEFVVLCEKLHSPTETHVLAERLIAAVAVPFPLGETSITLTVSIGIAVASEPLADPVSLLRAADQAMFDAKASGRNRFTVYDAGVHGRHHVRLQQAMALRRLVEHRDLLVHYQPIVDLSSGAMIGAEALLRWRGDAGLPDTATAIGLAEESGLIGRIGRFVLREATSQASTFVRPNGSLLPMSVNLAPQQLEHRLIETVEQAAETAGYPIDSLTLELTERTVMSDPRLAIEVLTALREQGVRIALDDFGVGHSSLAALSTLPLDVLKIDAGFIRGLLGDNHDSRIITTIVELARILDLDLVAEGIEQPEQRDRLIDLGCRTGQGWLYSAAQPPEELRKLSL